MNKQELAQAIITALMEHSALDAHITGVDAKPELRDGKLHIELYNTGCHGPAIERCTLTLTFSVDSENGRKEF